MMIPGTLPGTCAKCGVPLDPATAIPNTWTHRRGFFCPSCVAGARARAEEQLPNARMMIDFRRGHNPTSAERRELAIQILMGPILERPEDEPLREAARERFQRRLATEEPTLTRLREGCPVEPGLN